MNYPFLTKTRAAIYDGYIKVAIYLTKTKGKNGASISSILTIGHMGTVIIGSETAGINNNKAR